MFEKAAELIASDNTVIIHRHTNPDGDAIGAQAGLRHLINDNFPGKKVYIVGDSPKRYSFMDDSDPDTIGDDTYRGALAVILDTSSAALISDDRWKLAGHTLRIDHHIFCEKIADDEITDTSYESCCGIVADMARTLGWRLGVTAAKSLYTGMVTDSGRFRYDSVTPRTFGLAAYLTSVKFDTGSIFTELYADTYQNVLNRAKFVLKIRFTEKGTAYIYNTKEEVAQSGLEPFAVSRGMVGTMAELRGVYIWTNFTETDEGVWCEIRSSKYNVNPIAVKYGGGGHQKASGCTLKDRAEAMALLNDLDALQCAE